MKVLQHTLKLAMIAIVLVFTSCSKDDSVSEDNAASDEPTNHELLMTGKWYIHATSMGGATNDCERQSYFQFIDEDTLIVQYFHINGEDICVADPIDLVSYFISEDDTITLEGEPDFYFVIEMISETELLLRQTDGVSSILFTMQK
jgi:hypothetical protein